MKMTVVAISRTNIQGTSKKGLPYHIDQTNIVVALPFDNEDGFGIKTHEYNFGNSQTFEKFKQYRGKLPQDFDITLTTELNQYGQPVTVVSDVQPVSSKPVQGA